VRQLDWSRQKNTSLECSKAVLRRGRAGEHPAGAKRLKREKGESPRDRTAKGYACHERQSENRSSVVLPQPEKEEKGEKGRSRSTFSRQAVSRLKG